MEEIFMATCIRCGEKFWETEAYRRKIIEGKRESLCEKCDIDDGIDDSKQATPEDFDAVEPDPGD